MNQKGLFVCICLIAAIFQLGCQTGNKNSQSPTANANQPIAAQQQGVEKAKPAPGTGNVQLSPA
jgi:hypothetical protein